MTIRTPALVGGDSLCHTARGRPDNPTAAGWYWQRLLHRRDERRGVSRLVAQFLVVPADGLGGRLEAGALVRALVDVALHPYERLAGGGLRLQRRGQRDRRRRLAPLHRRGLRLRDATGTASAATRRC